MKKTDPGTYRALWHLDQNRSSLQEDNLGIAGEEDLVISAAYSMISTGTERLVARGELNDAFMEHMKVPFMKGSFSLPIQYGYSMVGLAPGGDAFHFLHPHQDQVHIPAAHLYPLPKSLPLKRAALLSNMETVINAFWDAGIQEGERVGILGFGNIGSLLAYSLLSYWNIHPVVFETDSWRALQAQELGFQVNATGQFDVLFHTTASGAGLQFGLKRLHFEGRLIELSWYGNKEVTLHLGDVFHYNRLTILSSQVSSIPLKMRNKETFLTRKELAAKILADDGFDRLIEKPIPFEESPFFFERLRKGQQGNGIIWLIEY